MGFFTYILTTPINIVQFLIIVSVIASWLIAFNIINPSNQFIAMVLQVTNSLTEPLLRPIRRRLPDLGGIDIAPLVLFIGLEAIKIGLHQFVLGRILPA